MKVIIILGGMVNCLIFAISTPTRARQEMAIPIARRIMVWGILVLEENSAAAKTIAKNIGIRYSSVNPVPPPANKLKVLLLLVVV